MALDLGPEVAREGQVEDEPPLDDSLPTEEADYDEPDPWIERPRTAEDILDSAARLLILKSMGHTLSDEGSQELATFIERYRAALKSPASSEG